MSSVIDDLGAVGARGEGAGVGQLLTWPAPVSDDARLRELLVVVSGLRNLADALLVKTVAAIERSGMPGRVKESVTSMMVGIGVPPAVASHSTRVARALTTLPTVAAALSDARMSGEHAYAVVAGIEHIGKAVDGLDADTRDGCVRGLLARAVTGVPADVKAFARKRALELLPADAPVSVAENRDLNTASLTVGEDGRTRSELDLDVVAGEKLRTALDPLMTPVPLPDGSRDPRDAGKRRADALEQIVDSYLRHRDRPTSGGVHPHLVVNAPLSMFTPRTDTVAPDQTVPVPDPDIVPPPAPSGQAMPVPDPVSDTGRPDPMARVGVREVASFDTGQPITPQIAEMLSCDSELTAVIVDAQSVPLDLKRMDRLFPPHLRRALILRDQGCSFPGCGRPPAWCQAHHLIHWSNGGETSIGNGGLLCQEHHTLIHATDWEMIMGGDGHPWFRAPADPRRPSRPRQWIRSHARRTLTSAESAAS